MNNFSLTVKTAGGVVIMTPKGYLNDLGAERLGQTSEEFLDQGLKKLVVNFANVQHINSIGLSIVTEIVQKTRESRCLLCFTNVKKVHHDIFEVTGITKHVQVFHEEGEALTFLDR